MGVPPEILRRLKAILNGGSFSSPTISSPTFSGAAAGSLSGLALATPTITPEAWREVGASGQPAFENSWTNYDAGALNSAAFYRDSSGRVHLKGYIKTTGVINTTAFTLPAGYRPAKLSIFCPISLSSAGRLDISAAGGVKPTVGSAVDFGLDGVSFKAEQ